RLAVDLRPLAPRPPREEALQVVRLVETPRLRVDPAVAERNLERLGVGDSRDAGALLRELHPHAGLLAVVGVEPLRPRAARAEHLERRFSQRAAPAAPSGRAAGSRPRPR